MTPRALLTVSEVADLIGFSEYTVRLWAREGRIPAVKFGRNVRFEGPAITLWLANRPKANS